MPGCHRDSAGRESADSHGGPQPWAHWHHQVALPAVTVHPNLVAMADAAVALGRDREAIDYYGWRATHGDLDRLSRGFAEYLRRRGLRPGDRVAVYLQTSPHFIVAALGIWRAGGVVVTMNPMYRQREVAHLLSDSGAVGVVSSQLGYREVISAVRNPEVLPIAVVTSEVDVLSELDARVFVELREDPIEGVDDLMTVAGQGLHQAGAAEGPVGSAPDETAGFEPGSEDLAVLCYTSGTTGPAKGAMLSHGNLATAVARNAQWLGTGADSVLFGAAPLFHVVGLVLELLHLLQTAGRLVLTYRVVPEVVLELVAQHRPVFVVGPPTLYAALMACPEPDPATFASVTRAFAGGAMLPPAIVEEFQRRFSVYLNNGYGLTETCGACVFAIPNRPARVDPATEAMSNGVPLPDTEVRIVGDDGRPVPVGERGEIQVRGPVVTRGYWRQPEETATAVVDGWFRTGDVGFFDDEHVLYCADRIKDMIVASGFKVWPGEVEQVLYSQGTVQDAAVVGVPDPYRGETVKAVVTLKPGAQTTAESLIAWCREHLAAYKVPREVEIREQLPRNVAGKILRRELR